MNASPPVDAQPKGKAWLSLSAEDALAKLGSAAAGLSAEEAASLKCIESALTGELEAVTKQPGNWDGLPRPR
ncbi:MAG: hypothetical protein AUJ52_07365 [Elusimicrobia bacterium CG1_02_63_36]|nr:MAG: hypothetical protein AUJ52_07365 [Elusimicrobia bacterium CG1_02_63_36]